MRRMPQEATRFVLNIVITNRFTEWFALSFIEYQQTII